MSSTQTDPVAVETILLDALAEMGPDRSDIRRDSTFEDLDIDSLDLVEVAQIVEETWSVELDPEEFASVRTIGEALDLIVARLP